MYHAHSLLFGIFLNVIFVNGTTIPLAGRQDRWNSRFYAKPCPNGLPGRVTQIQEQPLARPAIRVTDCSPPRNNTLTDSNPFEISTLDKRQIPGPRITFPPSAAPWQRTTQVGASSTTNGNGANTNSNSASGSAPSGALPGSQSGSSGSHTTTLSNGSVLVLPTPSFASGDSSETGNQQSNTSSTNIPAIVGAVLGLISFLALIIILMLLWRRKKKRVQRQRASLGAETPYRELLMARAINADPKLHAAPVLGSENAADVSETPMTEAVPGGPVWATSEKARMYAEEAMPGTSATDLSSIEPSAYTTSNTLTDSPPASVYQTRREMNRGSRDHPPHPQQTGNASSHRDRAAYASDSHPTLPGSSNSMSARTFAQAAAPNLSPSDIDLLAESIVARMQGRDPALRERIVEEAGLSTVTEDEPPPPWSAPGVDVHGL